MTARAHHIGKAIVATTLAIASAVTVHAQDDVPRRSMSARFEAGFPRVTSDARDLVDAALNRRLQSGLPQTLDTRVYAYAEGSSVAIAIGARSCRITHDPWRLIYRVQIQTASSDRFETTTAVTDVVEACLSLRDFPVGRAEDWSAARGHRVWFAVLVELNPISPDTVHRIRRWLARPDGASMEGDAFFGSFVSLFVNRQSIGEAERTFRFRSAEELTWP